MKFSGACFILFTLFFSADGLFGFFDPSWNTLRVTFGLNIFSSKVFAKMPLTRHDAEVAGFKQIGDNNQCSGDFQGFRYLTNRDPAVITIYDVKGYVAGIQTSFAENTMKSAEAKAWFKQHPMFTTEHLPLNASDNYHTLTAYLVDPNIICTTGRTAKQFEDEAAGIDLYLKNGTNNILIPKQQSDIGNTNWTLGKCFPSMGVHYWYATSENMNCNYFQPFFLLYNHKKLTGFGLAALGYFDSYRYEHPGKAVFGKFMKIIPNCLNKAVDDIGGLSTMHVYMNAKPWNLAC
uniref:Uncharacterized protein n=1 Tax=Strigamia maritima TaxID=126957 RepID=T1JA23_STRMM